MMTEEHKHHVAQIRERLRDAMVHSKDAAQLLDFAKALHGMVDDLHTAEAARRGWGTQQKQIEAAAKKAADDDRRRLDAEAAAAKKQAEEDTRAAAKRRAERGKPLPTPYYDDEPEADEPAKAGKLESST
jgi:hypothetical protein